MKEPINVSGSDVTGLDAQDSLTVQNYRVFCVGVLAQEQLGYSQYLLYGERAHRLKMAVNRSNGIIQRFITYIFMAVTPLPFSSFIVAAKFGICRSVSTSSYPFSKFVVLDVSEI